MNDTNYTLLPNGTTAFPRIIECIRNAKQSISIWMFVWRDDSIGQTVANELLQAAERGVTIEIYKDRVGLLFEYSEEGQASLFHKEITPYEHMEILIMEKLYNPTLFGKHKAKQSNLYTSLMNHPNIHVHKDTNLYDHSKIFIFDHETMILGGINIEDKENGQDIYNRIYSDLMVEIHDTTVMSYFLEHQTNQPIRFNKHTPQKSFHIKETYLKLLDNAQKEIIIMMPYFSYDKEIMQALYRAIDRDVTVSIIVPKESNFITNLNTRTIKQIFTYAQIKKKTFHLYFTSHMTHTKLIYTDQEICFGSANITKKSFYEYGETNLCVKNEKNSFTDSIRNYIENEKEYCTTITDLNSLSYSGFNAWMESILL